MVPRSGRLFAQFPLRWRLTIWYLLTLSFILLLFATFLYFQLRANLRDQLDITLQLAASQVSSNVTSHGDALSFQDESLFETEPLTAGMVFLLVDEQGNEWGRAGRLPAAISPRLPEPGYETIQVEDDSWRSYSQPVISGEAVGWLLVMADTDSINDTLDRLLTLMFIGGPLVLLLAGLGGLFLASRALRPIDRMTQTARQVSAADMEGRIHYRGPADEVGRLAQTFDQMLERLERAFIRERRFTGDAAHELRTPLTALKGRLEVTLSQPRDNETYQATLAAMETQVDRLIRLSSDLLYMSRLEQKQVGPSFEKIGVADLLGAVIDQMRPLAEAKEIELADEIPAGLQLNGDLDHLIRLFLNLLDNAVKFTPPGGVVSVSAAPEGERLVITVTDSGPGIPAEHLPHLFDRFYRAESARSRQSDGGTGLGLAIAQEIVRLHRGEISVESEVGQGTTIYVRF